MGEPAGDGPGFGPSGYLPERAARRARKIVLRAPLGAHWVVASLVAAVVLAVAGVVFLQRGTAPPPEPWIEVGPLETLRPTATIDGLDALVVAAGGRVRVFAGASELSYCEESNRIEAVDGRVWSLTGRGLAGADSLAEHPAMVVNGDVYVDPRRTVPGPTPSDEPAEPGCG